MSAALKTELQELYSARLAESGLTHADAERLGLRPIDAAEAARRRVWRIPLPALEIPYTNPWPDDDPWTFSRYRCLKYPVPRPQKFPKYTQPKGSSVYAYFPTLIDWRHVLEDPAADLYITEGELKAAAGTKYGFNTIGLGGIESFQSRSQGMSFLPELDAIVWRERKVTIIYDSDISPDTRVNAYRARQRLANQLIARGATVLALDLPSVAGQKMGLDDFLKASGAAALRQLLATELVEFERNFVDLYEGNAGGPFATFSNVAVALDNAPEVNGVFYYDEFQRSVMMARALPDTNERGYPRLLEDDDVLALTNWFQTRGGLARVADDVVYKGVRLHAREHAVHPVRQHLSSLKWDARPRLDSWLREAFSVDDALSTYARAIGRMFLISMVARVFDPGCKADYMLVLEGEEGEGKSTACAILAGNREWFSDDLPDLHGDAVRVSQHLRGKWLIEVAELSGFRRSDMERIKSFLTRPVEVFTPKYVRVEVHEPRQCVFIGTTNLDQYLRDDGQNRRFWPVEVRSVDFDWLTRNRDQLLAEAVVAFRAGERHYPDRAFELRHIAPEQAKRRVEDTWETPVLEYARLALEGQGRGATILTRDVATQKLGVDDARFDSGQARRISAILKRAGWQQSRSNGVTRFVPSPVLTDRLPDKVVPLKRKKF